MPVAHAAAISEPMLLPTTSAGLQAALFERPEDPDVGETFESAAAQDQRERVLECHRLAR